MNILVIGSGGREHALARKLGQSPRVTEVFVIKGNDAMAREATIVDIAEDDHDAIVQFAQDNKIELVVVGPEQPLIDGLSDRLVTAGIKVFGPNSKAAQMEGSKDFAKVLMKKYDIPTASYETIENKADALKYLEEKGTPIVINTTVLLLVKVLSLQWTAIRRLMRSMTSMQKKVRKLSLKSTLKEKNIL